MPPAPEEPAAVRAGPKHHPVINAGNLPVYEAGVWRRFLLRRAPPHNYTAKKGGFFFSPLSFSYAWSRENGMELRAFGTTQEGFSMCVRVLNFPPYFFARLPDSFKDKPVAEVNELLRDYALYLNTHVRNGMRDWERKRLCFTDRVVHINAARAEEHHPTMVFSGKQTQLFARIFMVHPSVMRAARTAVEFPFGGTGKDGREHAAFLPDTFRERGVPEEGFLPFEADADYVVRFLTDTGLSASAWWHIKGEVTEVHGNARASTCNLEILATASALSPEIPSDVAAEVAPYIRAKFDIEVKTSLRFPQPATSEVIQISLRMGLGDVPPTDNHTMVTEPMKDDEYTRAGKSVNITLCLGSVRPRAGFVPICFDTEEELLWAFFEIVPVLGIDDLAGHFSDGFDFWFLLERAKVLKLENFRFLGRVPYETAFSNVDVEQERRRAASKAKFQRRQKEQYMTKVPGVCVWDFLFYAVAFERSATSFSLNALAAQFLKDKQKLDVEYALIAKMQQTEEGRTQLAEYCDRDVLLVQLLDAKIGASAFMRELSDLSFVPRQQLLNKASVFRATARWMYEAQRYGSTKQRYLMPSKSARKPPTRAAIKEELKKMRQTLLPGVPEPKVTAEEKKAAKYSGGTVIEPCTGYYTDLVVVYDFMSLYPALMQLFNICYTTILPPGQQDVLMAQHGLTEDDVWHAPLYELRPDGETTQPRICKASMPSFVKVKCMEGILPYIERTLAILRSEKKAMMNNAYKKLNELTPNGVLTPEQRQKLLMLAKICNNQQLCIKIFMNSLYGVMGAAEATFPLRDGARTVTSEARQAIELARYNAETHFKPFMVAIGDEMRKITDLYAEQHTNEAVQEFIRNFNAHTPDEGLPFIPEVIYGDTDSIMVRYRNFIGDDPMMDDFERVLRAEKYNDYMSAKLSEFYGQPMCLQFEKACTRFYSIGKKKYMLRLLLREGGKYTRKDKQSGTCGVRRDGCQLQRMMCSKVLKALLVDTAPEAAIEAAREMLAYVMSGRAKLDEVLMCSTVSQPIANYANPGPPHVELARKLMRAGERPYNKGDRVYFIVVGGDKRDAIRERVRTPQDVIDNDIPYCTEYYGMNVILRQAQILLGPLVDPRTYEEKREFQRWARIVSFQPDGKAKIEAAKKKIRAVQDEIVTRLVLHGLPLEATRTLEQATIGSMFGDDIDEDAMLSDDEDAGDDEQEPMESEDDEASAEPENETGEPPIGPSDAAPACSTGCAGTESPRAAESSQCATSGVKRAREEEPEPAGSAAKRARTESSLQGPGKRAREATEDDSPAAKKPCCDAPPPKPFFSANVKRGANGGISAAFKSIKSVGAATKRTLVKGAVPKSSPLFASVVVYDRCVGCNTTVTPAQGYICAECEAAQPDLRRKQYLLQQAKTKALEREHNLRWNKCTDCRGRLLAMQDKDQCDITHCINYVCPNWGRRKVVTQDLRKAQVKLSKLGKEQ